jgi:transcriptional regulator with XRE-family HTH domain
MLENQNKFPSSEMIQKLASALKIDPTELFGKEIDPISSVKNSQKAALENVGMAVNRPQRTVSRSPDSFTADYLLTRAIAAHKTPADIIGEMVQEQIAAAL